MKEKGVNMLKKETEAAATVLGVVVAVGSLIVLSPIFYGYVGMMLWNWFMVPGVGVRSIGMPVAYGIALLTSFWTYQALSEPAKEYRADSNWFDGFIRGAVTLFFGWICHHFFMPA